MANPVQEQKQPLLTDDGDEEDFSRTLDLIGEIITITTFGLSVFTVFITLKITGVVNWMYWAVSSPLWLVLFILLVLTQSKRFVQHTTIIIRLAWFLCVVAVIAFLVLLNLKLEKDEREPPLNLIFLPLWILFGIALLLGMSGLTIGLCFDRKNPKRKKKYLLAGVPLLLFDLVFFPFMFLLELKIQDSGGAGFGWSIVFIPIWITDTFFLYVSCVLFLFTIGARDSAVFSISQVITFLCILTGGTVFTILLVLVLEGAPFSPYVITAPLLLVELLCVACGLNVRFGKHKKDPYAKVRVPSQP